MALVTLIIDGVEAKDRKGSSLCGIETKVSTILGIALADAGCNSCLACVAAWPVGALVAKQDISMEDGKTMVAQLIGVSPSG